MEEPKVYKLYLQPGMKLVLILVLVVLTGAAIGLSAGSLLTHNPKMPPWPFGLILLVIVGVYLIYFFNLPHRITLNPDGTVEFTSILRRRTVRVEEIKSIKPEGSQFGFFVVRTEQDKIRLLAQFDDFHDFLTQLQAKQPGVELRGC